MSLNKWLKSLIAVAFAIAIACSSTVVIAAKGGNGGGNGGGGSGGGGLTAVDDSGSVVFDDTVTLNVLSNDAGGAKTVISVTQGAQGSVAISGTNSVIYTPAPPPGASYPYDDNFTYTMTNKKQSSEATGTVTITVTGPNVQLVPLTSWGDTEVRRVLSAFAYGGLATDAQIAAWAAMTPVSAINEMLTFGINNDKLSPIVDANANYCGALKFLQEFWSGDDPGNIMKYADRYRYAQLSSSGNLSTSNLQRTWVKMINTRGCNPFLHKMALYFTNYHAAISAHKTRPAIIRDYYDDIVSELVSNGNFVNVVTAAAGTAAVARAYGHQYNRFRSDTSFDGNDDFAREYFQLFFRIMGTTEDPTYHEDTTIEHNAWLLTGMNLDKELDAYGAVSSGDWYVSPLLYTDHQDSTGRNIWNVRDHFNHYNGATCLEILHNSICGADAGEKLAALGQIAASHPESLDNVPATIIDFFADDNLDDAKLLAIRTEWAGQNFNILGFIRAYAISTIFHDPSTYKFKTAFDRNLEIQNGNMLTNQGTFGRHSNDSPYIRMDDQGSAVFEPAHDVFGGQSGLQAANNRFLFKHAYEVNISDPTFIDDLSDEYTLEDGGPILVWEKAWQNVIPTNGSGQYVVGDVANWLWQRFVADGGTNFDALARAQVHALLAQGRDFGYLVDANDAERVFSSAEITAVGPLKDLDAANAAVIMDFNDNGNSYVGRAINFITVLPFAFARGGN